MKYSNQDRKMTNTHTHSYCTEEMHHKLGNFSICKLKEPSGYTILKDNLHNLGYKYKATEKTKRWGVHKISINKKT